MEGVFMIKNHKRFSFLWIIVMIFALGSLCGCEDKEEISRKATIQRTHEQAYYDCVRTGGIPIISKDGMRLENCIYKPEKNN
jgi:hypothetical protein